MLFTSIDFAIFLLVVLSSYWFFRKNLSAQKLLLLVSSYFFYGFWDVRFLFLIVISTAIDYCSAQMIDQGKVKGGDRARVSAFVLASSFVFLVLQYKSIEIDSTSILPSLNIHWEALFSDDLSWIIFSITLFLLVVFHFIYPSFLKMKEDKRRKFFMLVSIGANMSILGFFKYFNFFVDSFSSMSSTLFGVIPETYTLNIILPVGISFYTFQTMSYTIDVYRGELKASKKFIDFAAYVSFFPQLVAGPIERGKQLLPQFHQLRPTLKKNEVREGIWLIGWGLFKKLVIADNVAIIVNTAFLPFDSGIFDNPVPADGLRLLFALYAFAFQIYCDFSGYTDIARGTAKLFGFNLMVNFRLPYFATDPSSFWQRWHISLSSWLRDYLYIPLGGNRGSSLMTYRNLFLTMLLGGLWHGASWTFVLWGAFHGALLSIYRFFGIDAQQGKYTKWKKAFMILIFFHLTCIGWLIFRSQNVETIWIFLESIIFNPFGSAEAWDSLRNLLYYTWFLILFQFIQYRTNNLIPLLKWHWFIRLNIWIYIIMALLVLASPGGQEFIYFAF